MSVNLPYVLRIVMLLSCATQVAVAQQLPVNSLALLSPYEANAAFAGKDKVWVFALNQRNQWSGIEGAPKTLAFHSHAPVKRGKMGLGLDILADNLGAHRQTTARLTYAYRLKLGENKLAFALRGGVTDYRFLRSALTFAETGETLDQLPQDGGLKPIADAALLFTSRTWVAGLQVDQLIESPLTDMPVANATLVNHLRGVVEHTLQAGPHFELAPAALIRMAPEAGVWQGDIWLRATLRETLTLGAGYRTGSGLLTQINVRLLETMHLAYAFDLQQGAINSRLGNSHEFALRFDLNLYGAGLASPRYF